MSNFTELMNQYVCRIVLSQKLQTWRLKWGALHILYHSEVSPMRSTNHLVFHQSLSQSHSEIKSHRYYRQKYKQNHQHRSNRDHRFSGPSPESMKGICPKPKRPPPIPLSPLYQMKCLFKMNLAQQKLNDLFLAISQIQLVLVVVVPLGHQNPIGHLARNH